MENKEICKRKQREEHLLIRYEQAVTRMIEVVSQIRGRKDGLLQHGVEQSTTRWRKICLDNLLMLYMTIKLK
jgi:hypothetical protein